MLAAALLPALACVLTGAALYVSRGVLDQVVTPDGSLRVAFLPPWQALIGFTALAGTALLWLHHRHAPRGTSTTLVRPRVSVLVLPTFGLALLLLPYAPLLADRFPLLQALAGPGRVIVWGMVIAQLAWVSWQVRPPRLRWIDGAPLWTLTLGVGVAVAVLCGAAASRLTGTVLFPSGDEPHYLVISQSLWRDGDLKIENNHQRGDYREYFPRELEPHYLTRGVDGEIYSIHPIGVSVLMAPVYAAGGYRAVVLALVLIAAFAAAITWRWLAPLVGAGPATFAVAAVAVTAPYLLNSFTVYPEIVAALAAMVALTAATATTPRVQTFVLCGLACAALPWLSSKYALMSGMLFLVAAWRAWTASRGNIPWSLLAALATPYAVSVLGWFAFFQAYWGSPLPSAPYGALLQTSPKNLAFGAPGLFFDQEYGLLAYAPVFAIAAGGLVTMWKAGGDSRRRAIEVAVVFAALLGTVGAFRIWWGGSAAPARPLASGLLLLALPIAAAFRAAGAGTPRRAAHHALLWISVGLTLVAVLAQNGLLIANDRDGTSRLIEYLSPRWEAWTLVPSYIHHEAGTATLHASVWIAVSLAAGWLMARVRTANPGRASLVALTSLTAVVAGVAVVMPWLPATPPQPTVDLGARSRLALLDDFDRAALPNAIVYDPFRLVEPADTEPLMHLAVVPGARRDPQPVRVLHNGRFSLPAGRYSVDVRWTGDARAGTATLALQVGRIGPPLFSWTTSIVPADTWRESFDLPADANFVALRGSTDVENAIASITFTPLSIVDAGRRPRTPPVLSTQTYGDTMVLFHDEQTYPEARGFWTVGARDTQVTLAFRVADAPRRLRIHSGSIPNRAVLTMYGWQQVVDLEPGHPQDIDLPPGRAVADVSIRTEQVFVPSELDPSATDKRTLGIWVEFPR